MEWLVWRRFRRVATILTSPQVFGVALRPGAIPATHPCSFMSSASRARDQRPAIHHIEQVLGEGFVSLIGLSAESGET